LNTKLKHEKPEIAALVLCTVFFFGIYRAQNVNNAMVSNVAVAVKEKMVNWSYLIRMISLLNLRFHTKECYTL
jgi:hypothetical protein